MGNHPQSKNVFDVILYSFSRFENMRDEKFSRMGTPKRGNRLLGAGASPFDPGIPGDSLAKKISAGHNLFKLRQF